MIKIKRNPHLDDIKEFIQTNSIKYKLIDIGGEGQVYYFKLDKRLVLNTEILQPGEYVLKIFHSNENLKLIDYHKLLSKYGLIPKIYVITKKYIVMKYIKGSTLHELLESGIDEDEILEKVNELKTVWEKLGFDHLDLNDKNILVSQNQKHVYFIDPFIY